MDIKKIVERVFEEVTNEEINFNRANDNSARNCVRMNEREISAVVDLINYKAHYLNVQKDTIEIALHNTFRDWQGNASRFDDVMVWLMDFSNLN